MNMLPEKRTESKFEIAINQNREIFSNPVVLSKLNEVDRRVCDYSLNVPIGLISDKEMISKIASIAEYTARDVGIHGKLDKYDLSRFMEILKRYYRQFTLEEVKLAFELCVVGELDSFLPKDRNGEPDKNHYQVFSLEYITKVLNSYRKRREMIWSMAIKALPERTHITTKEEIEQIDLSIKKQIRDKFLNYRDNGVRPIFYVHIAVFAVMRDCGIITDYDFEISKESIEKAFLVILQDRTVSQENKQDAMKYRSSGTIANILKNRAGSVEQDKRVMEIFDKIIKDKGNIETLLQLVKNRNDGNT